MRFTKSFYAGLLLAGMTLGTAWAIRGQFGHEQGAAWAGAIGSLGVLLLAKRTDWYAKAFKVTLAGAIGWGLGGIMSYGIVVGYGHGSDFPNVYYGLVMLFVIGGLYGFLGGGLFGLALSDSEVKPVNWAGLLVEMVVMAIVFYFFIILQWGWLMTPPRSELWAGCLGMAVALAWHTTRHGYKEALRVALYAGMGGGFGFGFGNFLQVLGNVSGISFNFWNVMEYSLGFFGGVGMAYGAFTANWEKEVERPVSDRSGFAVAMLTLVIPLIVWDQSFGTERLIKIITPLSDTDPAGLVRTIQLLAFLLPILTGIYWLFVVNKQRDSQPFSEKFLWTFFLTYFGLYIFCSFLITGAFISVYRIEQYLYVLNFLIIAGLILRIQVHAVSSPATSRRWAWIFPILLGVLALAALVLIFSHEELKNAHQRF
jgi:hypothetical protein